MEELVVIGRALHLDAAGVDVQSQTSALEVADLKKKLASLKRLEEKFENSISKERQHIKFRESYQKLWMKEKLWIYSHHHENEANE